MGYRVQEKTALYLKWSEQEVGGGGLTDRRKIGERI